MSRWLAIGVAAWLMATGAGQAEERLRFAFITTCIDEAFFQPVQKGMRDAADMLGVDCTWTVLVTGNSATGSQQVISAALEQDPEIKFVLCTGQADTEGAGLAVERGHLSRGVRAAGFDLSPEILRLLKAGAVAGWSRAGYR